MNVLFIILLLMCAWHFVVQAIFIPNQAHDSKYKLYALRDRLRRLYIDEKINKNEFQNLDEFVSKAIKLYKNVTFYDLVFAKRPKSRASHVVASVKSTKRPANRDHSAIPASERKPISRATISTKSDEKRFESVDDIACPPRIDEGATGIVLKRLMMPFVMSSARSASASNRKGSRLRKSSI